MVPYVWLPMSRCCHCHCYILSFAPVFRLPMPLVGGFGCAIWLMIFSVSYSMCIHYTAYPPILYKYKYMHLCTHKSRLQPKRSSDDECYACNFLDNFFLCRCCCCCCFGIAVWGPIESLGAFYACYCCLYECDIYLYINAQSEYV